jgi:uncharacterized FlgJ-related protein
MAKKADQMGEQAAAARADEQARQSKIRAGTSEIEKIFADNFTENTFRERRDAYTNYALPQVDQQHQKAQQDLIYALTRNGQLDSSTRAVKLAELAQKNEDVRRDIGNKAIEYENTARNDVEQARAELIAMLNSTGDVEAARNSAMTRSRALATQPAYSPLGQLFAAGTDAAAAQAAQERAAAASGGDYKPRYNTGLFGGSSSVRSY